MSATEKSYNIKDVKWTTAFMREFGNEYIKHYVLHKVDYPKPKKKVLQSLKLPAMSSSEWDLLCKTFRKKFAEKLKNPALMGVKQGYSQNRIRSNLVRWMRPIEYRLNMLSDIIKNIKCNEEKEEFSAASEFTSEMVRIATQYTTEYKEIKDDIFHQTAEHFRLQVCDVKRVWNKICELAMKKLRLLIAAGDGQHILNKSFRVDAIDRQIIDLVLLYGKGEAKETGQCGKNKEEQYLVVTDESYTMQEQLRLLMETLNLVQGYGIEYDSDDDNKTLKEKWKELLFAYKQRGACVSVVVLQRRWYELKKQTRERILALWRMDETIKPHQIHLEMAKRYPHIVTQPLSTWKELVTTGKIVQLKETIEDDNLQGKKKSMFAENKEKSFWKEQEEYEVVKNSNDATVNHNEEPNIANKTNLVLDLLAVSPSSSMEDISVNNKESQQASITSLSHIKKDDSVTIIKNIDVATVSHNELNGIKQNNVGLNLLNPSPVQDITLITKKTKGVCSGTLFTYAKDNPVNENELENHEIMQNIADKEHIGCIKKNLKLDPLTESPSVSTNDISLIKALGQIDPRKVITTLVFESDSDGEYRESENNQHSHQNIRLNPDKTSDVFSEHQISVDKNIKKTSENILANKKEPVVKLRSSTENNDVKDSAFGGVSTVSLSEQTQYFDNKTDNVVNSQPIKNQPIKITELGESMRKGGNENENCIKNIIKPDLDKNNEFPNLNVVLNHDETRKPKKSGNSVECKILIDKNVTRTSENIITNNGEIAKKSCSSPNSNEETMEKNCGLNKFSTKLLKKEIQFSDNITLKTEVYKANFADSKIKNVNLRKQSKNINSLNSPLKNISKLQIHAELGECLKKGSYEKNKNSNKNCAKPDIDELNVLEALQKLNHVDNKTMNIEKDIVYDRAKYFEIEESCKTETSNGEVNHDTYVEDVRPTTLLTDIDINTSMADHVFIKEAQKDKCLREIQFNLLLVDRLPKNQTQKDLDPKLSKRCEVPLMRIDKTSVWKRYAINNTINLKKMIFNRYNRTKPSKHTVGKIQKSMRQTYPPEVLTKNPDFNISLKKLSSRFFRLKRNMNFYNQCVPVTVNIERCDDKFDFYLNKNGIKCSRVAKRIELPNIDEVRRINRKILTAQVAPITVGSQHTIIIDAVESQSQPVAIESVPAISDSGDEIMHDVPSQSQLMALIRELTDKVKGGDMLTRSSTPCCLASRHRRFNDARRRMAGAAGRQYQHVQIHKHEDDICNCCCKHLLDDEQKQTEELLKEEKAIQREVNALLSLKEKPTEDNISDRLRKCTVSSCNEQTDNNELKTRLRRSRSKKKTTIECSDKTESEGDDYQKWIQERNLASNFFGIKPRIIRNKATDAAQIPVNDNIENVQHSVKEKTEEKLWKHQETLQTQKSKLSPQVVISCIDQNQANENKTQPDKKADNVILNRENPCCDDDHVILIEDDPIQKEGNSIAKKFDKEVKQKSLKKETPVGYKTRLGESNCALKYFSIKTCPLTIHFKDKLATKTRHIRQTLKKKKSKSAPSKDCKNNDESSSKIIKKKDKKRNKNKSNVSKTKSKSKKKLNIEFSDDKESNEDDYQKWVRERNLASKVFGIKPRSEANKPNCAELTAVNKNLMEVDKSDEQKSKIQKRKHQEEDNFQTTLTKKSKQDENSSSSNSLYVVSDTYEKTICEEEKKSAEHKNEQITDEREKISAEQKNIQLMDEKERITVEQTALKCKIETSVQPKIEKEKALIPKLIPIQNFKQDNIIVTKTITPRGKSVIVHNPSLVAKKEDSSSDSLLNDQVVTNKDESNPLFVNRSNIAFKTSCRQYSLLSPQKQSAPQMDKPSTHCPTTSAFTQKTAAESNQIYQINSSLPNQDYQSTSSLSSKQPSASFVYQPIINQCVSSIDSSYQSTNSLSLNQPSVSVLNKPSQTSVSLLHPSPSGEHLTVSVNMINSPFINQSYPSNPFVGQYSQPLIKQPFSSANVPTVSMLNQNFQILNHPSNILINQPIITATDKSCSLLNKSFPSANQSFINKQNVSNPPFLTIDRTMMTVNQVYSQNCSNYSGNQASVETIKSLPHLVINPIGGSVVNSVNQEPLGANTSSTSNLYLDEHSGVLSLGAQQKTSIEHMQQNIECGNERKKPNQNQTNKSDSIESLPDKDIQGIVVECTDESFTDTIEEQVHMPMPIITDVTSLACEKDVKIKRMGNYKNPTAPEKQTYNCMASSLGVETLKDGRSAVPMLKVGNFSKTIDLVNLERNPPIPVVRVVGEQDPASVSILCIDRAVKMWSISGDYLIVTDLEIPTADPTYWTMKPIKDMARISFGNAQPIKKPAKPENRPMLKVRDFAKCKDSDVSRGNSLLASVSSNLTNNDVPTLMPARVIIQNKVYQKLMNTPLIYGRLFTVVQSLRVCLDIPQVCNSMYIYSFYTGKVWPVQTMNKVLDVPKNILSTEHLPLSVVGELIKRLDNVQISALRNAKAAKGKRSITESKSCDTLHNTLSEVIATLRGFKNATDAARKVVRDNAQCKPGTSKDDEKIIKI